jgi:Protein of unknown function (DUF3352)
VQPLSNGLATIRLNGFLVIGDASAVAASVKASRDGKSLTDADAASVRDSLPNQRLADVYLSPLGIDRLLARRGALSEQLDTFVDFGDSEGIAAALVAHGNGLELRVDSELGAAKKGGGQSFFQAFPSFDPSLADEFSAQTLLLLEVADPSRTVRTLLRQAGSAQPGLLAAFTRFEAELRRSGVDLERGVLPVLSGESAIGLAVGPRGPYLTAVFKDVDEDRARVEMAQLQAPLVAALSPARTGQAPSFDSKDLDGVTMRSVRISPALELAYAIFDGKLVVSTSRAGVRQAVEGGDNLGGSEAYQAGTSGLPGGVSALVFLNLEGLVSQSQPLGLGQIVRGFSEDVARFKGLGLTETSDSDRLTTTLFLAIQ